jgi:thiamine biosynthesis lipoprotein
LRKAVGFLLILISLFTGCADRGPQRVQRTYLDLFDTITTVTVYGADRDDVSKIVEETYARLNDVFDAYAPHEGVDGLYQLNNAGGTWVPVDADLLNLLLLCKSWRAVAPELDVTRGALFEIWRAFRDGERDLPTYDELSEAAAHGGWGNVEIDEAGARARLDDAGMRIDLGAVAKGYAAGKLAESFIAAGYQSYVIDAGGNVVAGEREKPFVIGVKNPRADGLILKLSMKDMAAVSSGDYQRLREYEGKRYHHIIDIGTLYPADYGIAQVTVIAPDSAFADFLSTTIFLMDYDKGHAFAEENGLSVVWVMDDGEIRMTDVAKGMAVN